MTIVAAGLTKRFGATVAVDSLDLSIGAGRVVGLLGPNGAGKTTIIRILLGLLRPSSGRAEILGLDCWRDRNEIHRAVGYLPGDFAAHGDRTPLEYLTFLGDLRGGVGRDRIETLSARFDLDLTRRIDTLSHGNRRKVGLVQAFMHEPEVLVLDEPTAGLDPLMQLEFSLLVREQRDAGRTVVLSSHVLDEVEVVADDVAMISDGKLLVVESVDALKERALRHLDIQFDHEPPLEQLRALPGVSSVTAIDGAVRITAVPPFDELFRTAAPHGIVDVITHDPDLEEIFLSYFRTERVS